MTNIQFKKFVLQVHRPTHGILTRSNEQIWLVEVVLWTDTPLERRTSVTHEAS